MRKIFVVLALAMSLALPAYAAGPVSELGACTVAKRRIATQLRDGKSADMECLPLIREAKGDVQAVRVNAKNAFGAYTGWETWAVVFMPNGTDATFTPADMKAAGLR